MIYMFRLYFDCRIDVRECYTKCKGGIDIPENFPKFCKDKWLQRQIYIKFSMILSPQNLCVNCIQQKILFNVINYNITIFYYNSTIKKKAEESGKQ